MPQDSYIGGKQGITLETLHFLTCCLCGFLGSTGCLRGQLSLSLSWNILAISDPNIKLIESPSENSDSLLRCSTPITRTEFPSHRAFHLSFHFLSVPLLCHCLPTLFLLCYMFLPSPLQSAVFNALLTCCLSCYLYSFHLSINTTTLDVLRLAFAI
jgi:hypothetical protein